MNEVSSDSGYFAMVPEWVLHTASANAVKIYALLRRYADKNDLDAYPSRRTLAKRMGFSRPASVDPAIAELVRLGALTVTPRRNARGDQDSNAYLILTVPPAHIVWEEVEPRFFMWVVRESGQGGTENRTGGGALQRTTGSAPERTTVVRESGHKPESPEPESLEPETLIAPDEVVDSRSKTTPTTGAAVDELFDTVWAVWPRKVEKQAARKAFTKALVRIGGNRLDATDQLIATMTAWTRIWVDHEHRTLDKIPHLASWLNGERWTDELPDVRQLIPQHAGKPLLPPAPIVRNRHCTHGYLPGARMPDGSIERCPHADCDTNRQARA